MLLAYAKGSTVPRHQSEHHVYNYKKGLGSSPECRRDLKLMMLGATLVHGDCIAQRFGRWDTITFVSSKNRPGIAHPVVELAKMIESPGPEPAKILLDIGTDIVAEPQRFPLPRRFEVAQRWQPDVRDKHVLVVDDTWVSGDKSQSASLALKAAGARAVTILCVARWLSWTYSAEHQQLIKARTEPYDALLCPVTGGECRASGA